MLKPDFSDIQNNGFRINQFRLIHSTDMRSKKFDNSKKGYVSSGDIIGERNLVTKYLIEQNEINFTIYYVTLRLMFLLILALTISLISREPRLSVTIILALFSII